MKQWQKKAGLQKLNYMQMGFEMSKSDLASQKDDLKSYVKSLSNWKEFKSRKAELVVLSKSVDKIKTTRQLANFGKAFVVFKKHVWLSKDKKSFNRNKFREKENARWQGIFIIRFILGMGWRKEVISGEKKLRNVII